MSNGFEYNLPHTHVSDWQAIESADKAKRSG